MCECRKRKRKKLKNPNKAAPKKTSPQTPKKPTSTSTKRRKFQNV